MAGDSLPRKAGDHRAYAKKAKAELPPLEDYEKKIIHLNAAKAAEATTAEPEKAAEALSALSARGAWQ